MNKIRRLLATYRGRPLLIAVAVFLFILNLGRMGISDYQAQKEEVENKQALLAAYENTLRQLPSLRQRTEHFDRQKGEIIRYFMKGESAEDISSKMQIMLQELVVKTGLEPEYIKPIQQREEGKDRDFHEISIKLRLAGNINAFRDFLAELAKSDVFFRIESFSLKPGKKGQLTVFLDLAGYYMTSKG